MVDGSCLAFALLEHDALLRHDYAAYACAVAAWSNRGSKTADPSPRRFR